MHGILNIRTAFLMLAEHCSLLPTKEYKGIDGRLDWNVLTI